MYSAVFPFHAIEIILYSSIIIDLLALLPYALTHSNFTETSDVKRMCDDTDLLLLLARVRERAGRQVEKMAALSQAKEMQAK